MNALYASLSQLVSVSMCYDSVTAVNVGWIVP